MPGLAYLSNEWIEALDAALASSAFAAGVRLVIQQVVTDVNGTDAAYHVTVEDGKASVGPGHAADPTVTFTQDHATAVEIATGRLSAQQAFMAGRLRVRGELTVLAERQAELDAIDAALAPVRARTDFSDA
jgi:putative sterol carrier protein